MLSLIVAMSENKVIGSRNELPWYLPRDLKHFSATTKGHVVVMGRNTYESIVARIGKPLPQRTNIIVTRQLNFLAPGCIIVHSLTDALTQTKAKASSEEVFIIGGAQLYAEALPFVDRLYITDVHTELAGDIFFPELNMSEWEISSSEYHEKDEKNPLAITFNIYERKK